jgi:dienelactone hydrolase
MLKSQKIDYRDDDTLLEGYYAYDDSDPSKKPAVLVCHDWSGKNDFACQKAEKLAELGYIGFALDMYGKGKVGKTTDEKMALIKPLREQRALIPKRIQAALTILKTLDRVDARNIGIIGFCFGGLCALDMARTGAALQGVVSFHGLLDRPTEAAEVPIQARILALHGYADPSVPPAQVLAFADEMTRAKADWQLVMYGNTQHAFTNPQANEPDAGRVYDKKADVRSWIAMRDFFKEVFGK